MTLMRLRSALFTLLTSISCLGTSRNKQTVTESSAIQWQEVGRDSAMRASQSLEQQILELVNQDRQKIGLAPLQMSKVVSAVAEGHSKNMADGKTPFGHEGVQDRVQAIQKQIGQLSGFGENVAYGQSTARQVVEEWLHSTIHRQNIEGNFSLTGIGLAKDLGGRYYFTEIFARQ